MAREGLVDFTGLIEDAAEAVPYISGDPAVFVVDEAQDCSVLELDLVRKWAERADQCVLAGDGDQAIYGWRGASARAFLDPKIPDDHNYHLTQSYRVPRGIHDLASKWIDKASYRYAVDYEPRDFDGEVVTIPSSGRNVRPLVDMAVRDTEEGKSVMILATCGFMLRGVIAVLRQDGIPFHNPYRPTHGGWNPLRGGRGRLLSYLRPDPETNPEWQRWWTWKEAKAWVDIVRAADSLTRGGKGWIRSLGNNEEMQNQIMEDEDVVTMFGEHWPGLRDSFGEEDPIKWLDERLLVSKRRMMEYPIAIARKWGRDRLRDDPKICVGTIHSTKGAEADIVYLFPDLSPSGMREWVQHGDGRDGIIRTFYVGMTRARERLVLAGRWSSSSVNWNG